MKNLFPEFAPALVCWLKNKKTILEKLYKLSNEFASTDFNSGIMLEFPLCGEKVEKTINKLFLTQIGKLVIAEKSRAN